MVNANANVYFQNFLGNTSEWYKYTIIAFLVINPLVFFTMGGFIAGWLLVLEFIFCLAMALKCYPLLPGGLLAIEAVVIGMTTVKQVMHEIDGNIDVILLLVFMVAGIHFMKDLLRLIFSKILLSIEDKATLSFAFLSVSAFLSAFLDALTVTAVIISVLYGFWSIYQHAVSTKKQHPEWKEHNIDSEELKQFRNFLISLVMHALVGTALGGVCTMIGEPQNLVIAAKATWDFKEFLYRMAPVTVPVLLAGSLTCIILEKMKWFGYGQSLPVDVRFILQEQSYLDTNNQTKSSRAALKVQGLVAIGLIFALGLHIANVGLIGLMVIVVLTAFNGIKDEHQIGDAFKEALPFTALLVVFFTVVAVIIDQKLFTPVIQWALSFEGNTRYVIFFIANGVLSMVSDNVFVGTVYINEAYAAWQAGTITRDEFDMLAVAINTGTNLPSIATPNGQAAFLFFLTSSLAAVLRLSYGRMVWMALPYTVVMTVVGLLSVEFILPVATEWMYAHELISHHAANAVDAVNSVH